MYVKYCMYIVLKFLFQNYNRFYFKRPNDCILWRKTQFTKEVIGKNTICCIKKVLFQKAKFAINQVYMNHCGRASTVTISYRARMDMQQAFSIVKHKNNNILSNIISLSDKQKQEAQMNSVRR